MCISYCKESKRMINKRFRIGVPLRGEGGNEHQREGCRVIKGMIIFDFLKVGCKLCVSIYTHTCMEMHFILYIYVYTYRYM